jgi:hypothetical protein
MKINVWNCGSTVIFRLSEKTSTWTRESTTCYRWSSFNLKSNSVFTKGFRGVLPVETRTTMERGLVSKWSVKIHVRVWRCKYDIIRFPPDKSTQDTKWKSHSTFTRAPRHTRRALLSQGGGKKKKLPLSSLTTLKTRKNVYFQTEVWNPQTFVLIKPGDKAGFPIFLTERNELFVLL